MPLDFTLKFIDGTPVPNDYAKKLTAFTRSILDCDITQRRRRTCHGALLDYTRPRN